MLGASAVRLMVLGVLIDIPRVVEGGALARMFLTVSMLVIMAWSWLYLCMPLRPTRCKVGYFSATSQGTVSTLAL